LLFSVLIWHELPFRCSLKTHPLASTSQGHVRTTASQPHQACGPDRASVTMMLLHQSTRRSIRCSVRGDPNVLRIPDATSVSGSRCCSIANSRRPHTSAASVVHAGQHVARMNNMSFVQTKMRGSRHVIRRQVGGPCTHRTCRSIPGKQRKLLICHCVLLNLTHL
jgi:hypothetical protein